MSISFANFEKYREDIKLKGHALVFGGSGGIGQEVVAALVSQGVSAISFTYDRKKERAEEMAKALAEVGIKTYFDRVELTDVVAVGAFLEAAVAAIGEEITMAVHTVGVSPNKPLREQTLEDTSDAYDDMGWRKVFDINVFGCFFSCRTVLKRMEEKAVTTGSMVIITSTNGVNSRNQISTHYDCSKMAQIGVVYGLAEEFKLTAHVNGVAPGWMDTPMNDSLPPDIKASEKAKIWVGEFGHPRLVAGPIAYLLSPAAWFIRGQNIMVDGGYRG